MTEFSLDDFTQSAHQHVWLWERLHGLWCAHRNVQNVGRHAIWAGVHGRRRVTTRIATAPTVAMSGTRATCKRVKRCRATVPMAASNDWESLVKMCQCMYGPPFMGVMHDSANQNGYCYYQNAAGTISPIGGVHSQSGRDAQSLPDKHACGDCRPAGGSWMLHFTAMSACK